MMRRSPRVFTLIAAAGAALLLTGCVPSPPVITPPPATPATPVFASDEEALAAAEAAYGEYMSVASAIIRDGGADPERLKPLVSADIFEREAASVADFVTNGWHGTGEVVFTMTLQQYDNALITVYTCDDYSRTDLIDESGTSVLPLDRPILFPYEVDIDVDDGLRIVRKDSWNGGGVC